MISGKPCPEQYTEDKNIIVTTKVLEQDDARDRKEDIGKSGKPKKWLTTFAMLAAFLFSFAICGGVLLRENTGNGEYESETEPASEEQTVPGETENVGFYDRDTIYPTESVHQTEAAETEPPSVTMQYLNGTYIGKASGGLPEGEGTLIWEEGTFEGSFTDGYPKNGIFYYTDSSNLDPVYGEWSYGGYTLKYETGIWEGEEYGQYTGMLLQGEPCGYGNLDFNEGNYRGTFVKGHPGGYGTYYYADGTKTSGVFTWEENMKSSLHLTRPGGTMRYTGMMKQNEFTGYGTLVFEKGGTFYGEFYRGSADGSGVYVFREQSGGESDMIYGSQWSLEFGHQHGDYPGYLYYGLVLDGQWQGYGLGITPKGHHYVGEVRDFKRSGYGRLYNTDNEIWQEGVFREGYLVE